MLYQSAFEAYSKRRYINMLIIIIKLPIQSMEYFLDVEAWLAEGGDELLMWIEHRWKNWKNFIARGAFGYV